MAASEIGPVLGEHYALEGLRLTPVVGGADLAASLWRAVDARGRGFAVKWSGGGSPAGLVLPAALGAVLPGSVPVPVPTRKGALWVDAGGARLSVMEWVEGTSALDLALGEEGWRSFGRLLAALHALPVAGGVRERVPREDFDARRWARSFERVDALVDGVPADRAADRLAGLWRAHRARLRRVHRRTLALAERLRARGDLPRSVPCHADPHLGNVVVAGDGHPVLLDFDDAVLAPPERDLMFVLGGGVLADLPATGEQQGWFLQGYGPHAVDADLLTYYRGLRVLEDASELARVVLGHAGPGADRREALGHVEGLLSPTGLLEQALRRGP